MKIFAIGLVGLTLLFSDRASAALDIYVVGTNATRGATNLAIADLFSGSHSFAGTSSDPYLANAGVFTGTFSGTLTNVYVSYFGGAMAIRSVAGAQTAPFVSGSNAGTNSGSVPDPFPPSAPKQLVAPLIAVSNIYQGSTPYNGIFQGVAYAVLKDQKVAVIPLKWLGSKNFPGSNVTTKNAQLLFTTGVFPVASFTGSSSDENKLVYAVGYNRWAGERYVMLKESGLSPVSTVVHFKPVISGASAGVGGFISSGTVTSHTVWPIETVYGQSTEFAGNGGAYSNAQIAAYLTATLSSNAYTYSGEFPSATAGYYLGYLSVRDSDVLAIPNGAVELKWNGVPYSAQNVQTGKYTFWSYEHVFYRNTLTGLVKQFGDNLANRIKTVRGNLGGIFLDANVRVSRDNDGGLVTPTYF